MLCFVSLLNTIIVAAVWMRLMECLCTFYVKRNALQIAVSENMSA